MEKSQSIGELAKALAAAQAKILGAKRDSENPFFKSKYADLAAVWDACRGPLSENGLSIIQTPRSQVTEDALVIYVDTLLAHSSGEWVSESLGAVPSKSDPQGIGSCITYLRRYALGAIVGVAPEDDDGNAASGPASGSRSEFKPSQKRAVAIAKEGPTQATAEVEALRTQIKKAMQALNDAGDLPEWTVERVNRMAKENFNGKTTVQLTAAELGDLAMMFSQRLVELQAESFAQKENIIASIHASAQGNEVESYLKEHHAGAALESLNLQELDAMDKAIGIPF